MRLEAHMNDHRPDQLEYSTWIVCACLVLAYVIMFIIGISLLFK